MRKYSLIVGFWCCALILACKSSVGQSINFKQQIKPILAKNCASCHGGVKQAGDVSFVTSDDILPPNGWVVEPGDPEASLLIQRVISEDPEERMPPPDHGKALLPEEIELLREWIQQGAKWEKHWAFEKPRLPDLPPSESKWPIKDLDHLVLSRLTAKSVAPSQDALPHRWLRRVTLDLTGIPPTPEQRKSFLESVASDGPTAYEKVVDRLLASSAYGERWASVWLDQVRYADSKGLGLDGRRNIWKYRDWVIDAFNNDMPYSDFTIKQLAGDLIPNATVDDRLATAVHRLTQSSEEGGTDDEEFRIAAVLDRVNTTWQTWQGVTFGCVQCHSHPYDPFEHQEYYQFAAFFNNTRDCDLNDDWPRLRVPIKPSDNVEASRLEQSISKLRDEIWKREFSLLSDPDLWKPIEKMSASTNNDTKVVTESKATNVEFHTVDTVSKDTTISLSIEIPESTRELTAIRFTGLPLNPESAMADSEWGFVLSHVTASWVFTDGREEQPLQLARVLVDEAHPYFDPQESLNPKTNRGVSVYSRIHFARTSAFVLKQACTVPTGASLKLSLSNRVFSLGAHPIVVKRGYVDVSDNLAFCNLLTDQELNSMRSEVGKLIGKRNKIPSTEVPVLEERPEGFTRPTHVFVRGLFLDKAERVTPGTPASLPPLPEDLPVDRLALAHWMISSENPLAARVAVNRVWARLFGIGLVATEEDFGTSGELPSHPDLLDYLAVKFQTSYRYQFKTLIREIVLSRTYRQSSAIRPDLQELDSQNRLLARGPRHRLPAEMVRDQALAISGLLTQKVGGPPVHPPIPDGVWRPFVGDKWETPGVNDANRYRRSIYTYTKRSIPYPMFASFDSPSREFCAPRRLRSNTPLQALMALNDQTMQECAQAFAERMTQTSSSLESQIRFGFTLATCREPDAEELDALVQLVESYTDQQREAGMKEVASVLLNLDEVLTK